MTKYVVRHNNAWAVKNPQAEKVTKTFATQKEAIEYAKSLKKTTSVMVEQVNGQYRKAQKNGIKPFFFFFRFNY